jgi:hypothetical protein
MQITNFNYPFPESYMSGYYTLAVGSQSSGVVPVHLCEARAGSRIWAGPARLRPDLLLWAREFFPCESLFIL